MKTPLLLVVLTALLFDFSPARAQWQQDGTPPCLSNVGDFQPKIVSDGAGGVIVTWYSFQPTDYDIIAQHLSAGGVAQWTSCVSLCSAANGQVYPAIVTDGAGGAIVAWEDRRVPGNYDIYAQRVNAAGVVQWATNGVLVCGAANNQTVPVLVSDGAGGAIVTWQDFRNGANFDLYAQRVNAAGAMQWTANGVVVCTAAGDQDSPTITTDGAAGAIVSWYDFRIATSDIYAQRINAAGAAQWTANGAALCTAADNQYNPVATADGSGGAFVAWHDRRNGANYDVFAQRINAAGAVQWAVNGAGVASATGDQVTPSIVRDASGGVLVAWEDFRTGNGDVYVQDMSSTGFGRWTSNGVALCTATGDQSSPIVVTDGSGGALATWTDSRVALSDIYAQRINSAGAVQWTVNGIGLCTATGQQTWNTAISEGSGSAIVAWQDGRTGSFNIFAQRVDGTFGQWGHPEPIVTGVADIRGDEGGKVKVNWTASGFDAPYQQLITYYSIWRATDVATANAFDAQSIVTDPARVPRDFSGKALWVQHAPATNYYWEWIGNQNIFHQAAYTFSAPTRSDSTLQSTATEYFMVGSHTSDPNLFWPSNVLSGHSVDNLAPAAPLLLTAQRIGNYVYLKWNRVHALDLKNYSVYRQSSSGVTPIPANFLANDNDTLLTDSNAPASALYYIVTATDVHQNQGKPSNEAAVAPTTGAGNLPPINALTVLQNRPNPFAQTTQLEIGLPAAAPIHLEVFDVGGRRVHHQTVTGVKGWQELSLAGINDRGQPLASGVYFYKVTASGKTLTCKMLIAR